MSLRHILLPIPARLEPLLTARVVPGSRDHGLRATILAAVDRYYAAIEHERAAHLHDTPLPLEALAALYAACAPALPARQLPAQLRALAAVAPVADSVASAVAQWLATADPVRIFAALDAIERDYAYRAAAAHVLRGAKEQGK